jgi:hypothetical protein
VRKAEDAALNPMEPQCFYISEEPPAGHLRVEIFEGHTDPVEEVLDEITPR